MPWPSLSHLVFSAVLFASALPTSASGPETSQRPDAQAKTYVERAEALRKAGDQPGSLEAAKKAIQLFEELGDRTALANTLSTAGVTLRRMGDLNGALTMYFRALGIAEELEEDHLTARLLNNIGIAYRRLERFEEAMDFYNRSLALRRKLGDEESEAGLLNNIGVVKMMTDSCREANDLFRRSLGLKIELGDLSGQFASLSNLGFCSHQLGSLDQALSYYQSALQKAEELGSHYGLPELFVRMARAQRDRGDMDDALATLDQAIEAAERQSAQHDLAEAWKELAEIAAAQDRHADAYSAFQRYDTLRAQLQQKESQQRFLELEARYRNEKREGQIQVLESERRISDLERQRLRDTIRALAIGSTLLIAVLLLGLGRFRSRAKASLARARRKEREAQIAALEAKNAEIEARSAEMERFAYAISHDLKAPLFSVAGFLGVLESDLQHNRLDSASKALAITQDTTRKMARLIDDLLEAARAGRVIGTPEKVDLNELVHEVIQMFSGILTEPGARIQVTDKLPSVEGDRSRLFEVFQNLLENALRYGDRGDSGAKIEISMCTRSGERSIVVRDDGPGISPENHDKAFQLFERIDTSQPGSGIGLALVQRIIEAHGGRIWIESQGEGDGAAFHLAMPWSQAPGVG